MNLTIKLAFRYFLSNKTRTILTSLGIILAVFLLTSVSVLVTSLTSSLVKTTVRDRGDWHYAIYDMSDSEVQQIIDSVKIEKYGGVDKNSIAIPIENPINRNRTNLHLVSVSNDYFSMQPIEIIEGRFPTNNNEIMVPKSLTDDYPSEFFVGEFITINNSQYEIVGMASVSKRVEASFTNGYMLFTKNSDMVFADQIIYIKLSNLKADFAYIQQRIGETNGHSNNELLDVLGVKQGESVKSSIYTATIMIIAIIIIAAVAMISNSFLISLSERTSEYGLLSSLGASSVTLAGIVLTEAILLCLISLPIGILLGIGTIYATLSPVGTLISKASYVDIIFSIYVNAPTIFEIIGLSLLTVLLSSIIPIIRCAYSTVISSIRQNKDIKTKQSKQNRLNNNRFKASFFLATKYFTKHKKKSFAVIFSFALCIILLVSTTAFTKYGKKNISIENEIGYYNLECITSTGIKNINTFINDTYFNLSQIDGITESAWCAEFEGGYLECDDVVLSNEASKYVKENGTQKIHYSYYCISDETYDDLICQISAVDNSIFDGELSAISFGDFLCFQEKDGQYIESKIAILGNSPINIEIKESINKTITLYKLENPEAIDKTAIKSQFDTIKIIFPLSRLSSFINDKEEGQIVMRFKASNHSKVATLMNDYNEINRKFLYVMDLAEDAQTQEQLYTLIDIGAIIITGMIALISIVNIVNMNLSSIILRKREIGIIRSIGMTDSSVTKMLIYENLLLCMIAIAIGIFASAIISALLLFLFNEPSLSYILPLKAIGISSGVIVLFSLLSSFIASRKASGYEIKQMLIL